VTDETFKVPKKLKPVTLWVHPEGRVRGSLYLREQSPEHAGPEQPLEVLNQGDPFIVVRREEPEELRFYNMRSIIRVEHEAERLPSDHVPALRCQLQMMDGSFINGTIREQLPPGRARLLDYLNRGDESFIKIHTDEGTVYLINKAYIIHAHVDDISADTN